MITDLSFSESLAGAFVESELHARNSDAFEWTSGIVIVDGKANYLERWGYSPYQQPNMDNGDFDFEALRWHSDKAVKGFDTWRVEIDQTNNASNGGAANSESVTEMNVYNGYETAISSSLTGTIDLNYAVNGWTRTGHTPSAVSNSDSAVFLRITDTWNHPDWGNATTTFEWEYTGPWSATDAKNLAEAHHGSLDWGYGGTCGADGTLESSEMMNGGATGYGYMCSASPDVYPRLDYHWCSSAKYWIWSVQYCKRRSFYGWPQGFLYWVEDGNQQPLFGDYPANATNANFIGEYANGTWVFCELFDRLADTPIDADTSAIDTNNNPIDQ